MTQARVVRRYSNRKLYDTITRRYVTRSTVASLVAAGEAVRIIDQVSGGDITERTLARPLRANAAIPAVAATAANDSSVWDDRTAPLMLVGRAMAALTAPAVSGVGQGLKRRWGGGSDELTELRSRVEALTAEVSRLRRDVRRLRNPSHRAVP